MSALRAVFRGWTHVDAVKEVKAGKNSKERTVMGHTDVNINCEGGKSSV